MVLLVMRGYVLFFASRLKPPGPNANKPSMPPMIDTFLSRWIICCFASAGSRPAGLWNTSVTGIRNRKITAAAHDCDQDQDRSNLKRQQEFVKEQLSDDLGITRQSAGGDGLGSRMPQHDPPHEDASKQQSRNAE